jgi:hypothetical protein
MIHFQPSTYGDLHAAYGEGEEEPEEKQSAGEVLEDFAPAISSLLFGGDPRQQYEKKKAKLDNYKRLYNKAPNAFLRGIYANKIRTLQAEISALGEQADEARISVATTQMGKVGGVAMLVAGTIGILVTANFMRQKSLTEKARRKMILSGRGQ